MTLYNCQYENQFIAECSECGHEVFTEEDNFHLALARIKRDGWKVVQDRGEWLHICDSCNELETISDFEGLE